MLIAPVQAMAGDVNHLDGHLYASPSSLFSSAPTSIAVSCVDARPTATPGQVIANFSFSGLPSTRRTGNLGYISVAGSALSFGSNAMAQYKVTRNEIFILVDNGASQGNPVLNLTLARADDETTDFKGYVVEYVTPATGAPQVVPGGDRKVKCTLTPIP